MFPVLLLEIRANKIENDVDALVSDNLRDQPQASARSHGQIPGVVVLLASLPTQRLGQDRDEGRHRLVDHLQQGPLQRTPRCLEVEQVQLLVAHGGPELHGRYGNLLRRGLDGLPRERPEAVHVRQQEVVILRRYLHQALEGRDLHGLRGLELTGIDHDLHDKVPLVGLAEVGLRQHHRVVEGPRGLQLGLGVAVPHTLHHGREDVIRYVVANFDAVNLADRHQLLAEVAQGDERYLAGSGVLVGDVRQQERDQAIPLVHRDLYAAYLRQHLGRRLADVQLWCDQRGRRCLLHQVPALSRQLLPPVLQVPVPRGVLGG
mmetsp:Transcript_29930/g.80045  ORF Transcript_29930/g.80045 Transcript_29930/m.80045 type:complete len:318 (-) Transcript_29930:319-1272(-)